MLDLLVMIILFIILFLILPGFIACAVIHGEYFWALFLLATFIFGLVVLKDDF